MSTTLRLKEATPCQLNAGSPQVWGAGGWNIVHHSGVARNLRKWRLLQNPSRRLGVSAGGLFITFLENGYEPEEILEICLKLKAEGDNLANLSVGLRIPTPMSIWSDMVEFWGAMLSGKISNPMELYTRLQTPDALQMWIGGAFSLRPHFARLVHEYDLHPTNRMVLGTCDFFSREWVPFSQADGNLNTQEDLINALTASGSPPWIVQPVWYWDHKVNRLRLLTDGAMFHYNPTQFFDQACIVSTFRRSTQWPVEWKNWFHLYVSAREIFNPVAGDNRYVDPVRHLVIENGRADVAGLNSGISDETCREMERTAYNVCDETIAQAYAQGRLCDCD